jgi:hypothetical protein
MAPGEPAETTTLHLDYMITLKPPGFEKCHSGDACFRNTAVVDGIPPPHENNERQDEASGFRKTK